MFVLGVALGVAVVIAIDIANESASRAFTLSSESLVGPRPRIKLSAGPMVSLPIYTPACGLNWASEAARPR